MRERTKAEEGFIDQMTRRKMVDWCLKASLGDGTIIEGRAEEDPFVQHAATKKWISLVDAPPSGTCTYKILSAGWETAERFLKR